MIASILVIAAHLTQPTDSLTLARAIALGRERGVAAVVARAGTRIAETRVGQRRADLLPNVSAGGSATRQTLNLDEFGFPGARGVTDPFTILNLQLRVSETLLDWSLFARLKATKDSVIAAAEDAQAAGVAAGATAGVAFLRAVSGVETVRAREADSAVAARLLDQARALNRAGLTPGIDLTRSEVNFAVVRSQLSQARNLRDRTRLDLIRAVDFPPDTTITIAELADESPGPLPPDPAAAARFAREHRSELRAERQRLAVLEQGRVAIRAENLPNVTAAGRYAQSGRETGALSGTYLFQLGVNVPIFDGLRRQLRAREQGLRIEIQRIRLTDLERQVDAEARQALLDLATAAEQVQLAQERRRLAEQELTQAEDRFRAGVAGSIETTSAQTGLIAARDQVIQSRVGLAVARVAAYRALGILEQLP